MGVTELRRLRQLEEENRSLVADLSQDKEMLQEVIKKSSETGREAVSWLLEAYRIGLRRSCRLMIQSRKVYHYQSRRDDRAITQRIREIAETRIHYGVQRIHILLRQEGWRINHKKTHRIYCQEGLNLRTKRPRHMSQSGTDRYVRQ